MEREITHLMFRTSHLNLDTIDKVRHELTQQSIDSILTHIVWTDYILIGVGGKGGRILEMYKTGNAYMLRYNEDEYTFPNDEEAKVVVRDILESVL